MNHLKESLSILDRVIKLALDTVVQKGVSAVGERVRETAEKVLNGVRKFVILHFLLQGLNLMWFLLLTVNLFGCFEHWGEAWKLWESGGFKFTLIAWGVLTPILWILLSQSLWLRVSGLQGQARRRSEAEINALIEAKLEAKLEKIVEKVLKQKS